MTKRNEYLIFLSYFIQILQRGDLVEKSFCNSCTHTCTINVNICFATSINDAKKDLNSLTGNIKEAKQELNQVKDEQNIVRDQLNQIEKDLHNKEQELEAVETKLAQTQYELETVTSELKEAEEELAKTQEKLKSLEESLQQAIEQCKKQEQLNAARLRSMYMNSNASYLELLLGIQSLNDLLNRVDMIMQMVL